MAHPKKSSRPVYAFRGQCSPDGKVWTTVSQDDDAAKAEADATADAARVLPGNPPHSYGPSWRVVDRDGKIVVESAAVPAWG